MSKPLRIYVAGPYTPHHHEGNNCLREAQQNVDHAIEVGNELISKGHYVYVPHLSHYLANAKDGTHSPPFWYSLDNTFIDLWANALYYISPSKGADAELSRAQSLGYVIF